MGLRTVQHQRWTAALRVSVSSKASQSDTESRHMLRSTSAHQSVWLHWNREDLPSDCVVLVVVADIEVEVAQYAGCNDQVVRLVTVDGERLDRRENGRRHNYNYGQ